MSLGEKLLNLRKKKQLSQEEVAEKLNVTRQTVSKWETDQSTPDFDKIEPLCKLYEITADELVTDSQIERPTKNNKVDQDQNITKKRAIGIGIGVLLYFVAVVWVMITIPVLRMNPIVSSALFLLICGVATFVIVYTCMVYKNKEEEKKKEQEHPLMKQIQDIISLITVIIYLLISFVTFAWHITWIIWIVFGLIMEIIKLIFTLKGDNK